MAQVVRGEPAAGFISRFSIHPPLGEMKRRPRNARGALSRSHGATSVQTAVSCHSLDFAKTAAARPFISSPEAWEPLPTRDKGGRERGRLPGEVPAASTD